MHDFNVTELAILLDQQPQQSALSLIEQGVAFARQGRYIEAAFIFNSAQSRLLDDDKPELNRTLAELMQGLHDYFLAQQLLNEVSKCFARFDAAYDTYLSELVQLLSAQFQLTTPKNAEPPLLAEAISRHPTTVPHSGPTPPSLPLSEYKDSATAAKVGWPGLYIKCFQRFEVWRAKELVPLCSNRNGQAILRFLLAQPGYRASFDILIDQLWSEEEPEVARHKLRVAASALRRSLNANYDCPQGGGYLLCKDEVYMLNPAIEIKTDVARFVELYQAGHRAEDKTIQSDYYRAASQIYTGPFLEEDLYSSWSQIEREYLNQRYLDICRSLSSYYLETHNYSEAIIYLNALLKDDRCDEEAYQQLMRVYAGQGRRSEVVRLYQRCSNVLEEELGVSPRPETQRLYYQLLGANE